MSKADVKKKKKNERKAEEEQSERGCKIKQKQQDHLSTPQSNSTEFQVCPLLISVLS